MSAIRLDKRAQNVSHAPGHGGDLADAIALIDGANAAGTDEWLDLSTGIAPKSYPVPEIPEAVWSRLPGRREMDALARAACAYYAAPATDHLVAGPGSQAIIERLPELFPTATVAIIGPTYGGHGPAWTRARHRVEVVSALEDAASGGVTVLVNPNNPDGRTVARDMLERACEAHTQAGGWLIVDEAFGDTGPQPGAADLSRSGNVIVLRSLGKFFGLAGVRLGFAIAPPAMAAKLRAALGDWPVSGPAIAIGRQALSDRQWQREQRQSLARSTKRLDALLGQAGVKVCGGTTLFRLVETPDAPRLFAHLLRHRIYLRRFDYNPAWLRIGIPGPAGGFERLEAALQAFDA